MPILYLRGGIFERQKLPAPVFGPASEGEETASAGEQTLGRTFADGSAGGAGLGVCDLLRIDVDGGDLVPVRGERSPKESSSGLRAQSLFAGSSFRSDRSSRCRHGRW